MRAVLLVAALVALAFATSPPSYPLAGSMTFRSADNTVAGRQVWDLKKGLILSISEDDVTIFNLREGAFTSHNGKECISQRTTTLATPTATHWAGFNLAETVDFVVPLEILPEEHDCSQALRDADYFVDGFGGELYVDSETGALLAFGNRTNEGEFEPYLFLVTEWSTETPSDEEFELDIPSAVFCVPFSKEAMEIVNPSIHTMAPFINLKCSACKVGINVLKGRICNGLGAAACSVFPPAIPFCAVLAGWACKAGTKWAAGKACQLIRLC